MAGNFRLKEIAIMGFRGYGRREVNIDLSAPVTILVGSNRSGKSSTLNAIEWAIYGGEIAKKNLGIEERKGWLVSNRNCESSRVELVLESEEGEIRVCREQDARRKRSGEKFYFINRDGERLEEEGSLRSALGMEPRDFASSVYLHQEVIRDIVIAEPRIRKSALDRLLGVSDLRNLYDAFKNIKEKGYVERIDQLYQDLERMISIKAERYREEMEEAASEGKSLGVAGKDYSETGFRNRCASTLTLLEDLARRSGVEEISIPAPSHSSDFPGFSDSVKAALRRIRSENPQAKSQESLIEKKMNLEAALGFYSNSLKNISNLRRAKEELEKEGNLGALRSKHQELSRREAELKRELEERNSRINVINDTITYLEGLQGEQDLGEKTPCPSCEQDIVPAEVLQLLYRRKEEIREALGNLDIEQEELKQQKKGLQDRIAKLEELVETRLPQAEATREERVREIGRLLEREIRKDEDPEKLARDRMEEIDRELEQIKDVLARYNHDIEEVEKTLQSTRTIVRYLTAKKKSKEVEAIIKSREWEGLNHARDQIYAELDLVEKVREAVGEILTEISEERLRKARESIIEIYRGLVERPDFDVIEIDPRDSDVYAVRGSDRVKLVSFFNQGDMNCAALSIFLALGSVKGNNGPAFLILDDPTQSLDATQKTRLAKVLGKVAEQSQILLATMDEELLEALKREISKIKKVYRFGEWDPQDGPSIFQE